MTSQKGYSNTRWDQVRIRVSNHTGDAFSNAYPCCGLLVMSALDLKSGSMSCL